MTTKEAKKYQEEYEQGLHALTLEQFIKALAKKKKQEARRQLNLLKKATLEVLVDAKKAIIENEMLKAKVNQLKACKDKNSDIATEKDETINELRLRNKKLSETLRKYHEKCLILSEQVKQLNYKISNKEKVQTKANEDITNYENLKKEFIKETQNKLSRKIIDSKMARMLSCSFELNWIFNDARHGVSEIDLQNNCEDRLDFFEKIITYYHDLFNAATSDNKKWIIAKKNSALWMTNFKKKNAKEKKKND